MRRGDNPPSLQPQASSFRLGKGRPVASLASLVASASQTTAKAEESSEPTAGASLSTTSQPVPATGVESTPAHKPGLSIQNASKLKMMAANQRRKIQGGKRKNATIRLATTMEGEEHELPGSSPATATPSGRSESAAAPEEPQRRPIGTFETKDIKWKAVILGDLDKFMYPSLRLESLYDTDRPSTADLTTSRLRPSFHSHNLSSAIRDVPSTASTASMPTPAEVDAVMAATTKVKWELEKRFQNATQSAPANGHPRVDDTELRRLHFDTQLETAEGLLRKKDLNLLEAKRQQGFLEAIGSKHRLDKQPELTDAAKALALASEAATRERGLSLYQPHVLNTPQLIPRLPHTRKIIKEIQRHTSNDGQIQYYADKHNLFTKWKKLQVSEHHKLQTSAEPHSDGDDDYNEDDDFGDEDEAQPYSKLSPRSLFYHECQKKNVLPEPIFSRIHEVQVPAKRLLPIPRKSTFTSVVAKLVSDVHAKHSKYEDLEPTPDGKYATKKHHLALHLQHFGLGDAKLDALSKSLQHFQSIHVLDLSNNRLTDTSIIQLLESLEAASSPVRPPSSNGASGSGGGTIRRRGNDLRVLNLSQNDIGVAGCTQIARFLGICTQLTHLDLSHAKIGGSDAVGPLTSAIETHRSLQVVNMAYNTISSTCATLVGDMITQPSCSVTELDISWNKICRAGAIAIGRSLRTNTMLRKLNLAMNRFSDEGAEQLAAALAFNTSLVELDLSRNNLGGRSAVAFAFYLRKNRSLLHLRLDDNRIGATGAKALLRTVSLGSPCEFHVSAHDVESLNGEKDPIFDILVPSMLSPFALRIGDSPYDFAVASELIDSALIHRTCTITDITFVDDRVPKKPVTINLVVDYDRGGLVDSASGKLWKPPQDHGIFRASASFAPPPMRVTPHLNETSCMALVRIIERGFSSREKASLLALALNDLYMNTDLASLFVERLRGSIDVVEIIGRLWPCLVDGDSVFRFLQQHLTHAEQRRLIDNFGVSTIQFTTDNPTGRWTLNLGDRGQRKIALWFAILNAKEASVAAELHAKRTDSSQFGKGFNWRNASFNRKAIKLTYEFFDHLPSAGMLEFDYVSTVRHEDLARAVELSDDALDALLKEIGAEVFAIYIPLHKRKDLKYQLLLFHLAIANKFVTSAQAHRVLQYFPKNFETCRFKIILAVHRMLIDLENLGEMLDRLVIADRRRVYASLGYLNVVNPLHVDNLDFEVDFERDDEKALLRALVDLSMSCPMDMIRIESERSTVLVIYSMYQTNSVPAQGRMFFRYMTHPMPTKSEFLRVRSAIFKNFLCGERLRMQVEAALATGAGMAGNGGGILASSPSPPSRPSSSAASDLTALS